MPTQEQEPTLIIKGQEVAQFEALLDTIPHGYAKKIIQFINLVQQKRMQEELLSKPKQMVESKPEAKQELKEGEAYKNTSDGPVDDNKSVDKAVN